MIKLEDVGVSRSDSVIHIANLAPSYSFEFESLSTVIKNILSSEHRHIPIVSKNQDLVGIVTYMDILDALLRGASRTSKISQFMTKEVVFCEPSETIGMVMQKLRISRRDCLPLIKKGKLLGMVSENDFIKPLFGKYLDIPVGEIMSHKPFFITPSTSIRECIKTMVSVHYRRFPVVEKKELVGIVTGHDVLRHVDESNYNPSSFDEKIGNIMSTPVIHVHEHEDISDVIKLLIENKIGGVPVINEENALKGIITERDLIEVL